MKFNILRYFIIVLIMIAPVLFDQGCKKQPKCGCGKDMIFQLDSAEALVQFNESTKTALFYPTLGGSSGATYYFCNPSRWIDTLKKMNTQEYLLVSGKAYYDCTYLYNSSNYSYQLPPVYQVEVTSIVEDKYGKK